MDRLNNIIQKYGLTKDDLLQNAELLEEEGSYLNMCLLGYSANELRKAAKNLDLIKFDIQKAYDAGVNGLYYGGEIIEDRVFREKDILEDDYSEPILMGTPKVLAIEEIPIDNKEGLFYLTFESSKLMLTKSEMEAGISFEKQKDIPEEEYEER